MTRRMILLILLSIILCGFTSCTTRSRRNHAGSTIRLYLRNNGSLPTDEPLDLYIDGKHICLIEDQKNPRKIVVLRGLHTFRVVSEKYNMEGSSQIFIIGTGKEQIIRIDLTKTK
jgi:hypothetical protein